MIGVFVADRGRDVLLDLADLHAGLCARRVEPFQLGVDPPLGDPEPQVRGSRA